MGLLYTRTAPAGGTTLCMPLGLSVGRFGIDLKSVAFELDRLVAWTKVTVQEEVAQAVSTGAVSRSDWIRTLFSMVFCLLLNL